MKKLKRSTVFKSMETHLKKQQEKKNTPWCSGCIWKKEKKNGYKCEKDEQNQRGCRKSRQGANAIDLNTQVGSFLYGIRCEVSIMCSGPNEGELKQFCILVNFGFEGKKQSYGRGSVQKKSRE